ncbi:DNA primase [bacterium]|nr:DNA primase [bacterium]
MKIPQHKIDEIKQATDIVELIGSYVTLKLRGRNYVGLCPFHNEKTPSFTVSPDKQIFYCFGCGTGGDAFSFIKTYEKVSYPEAIRTLAERAHIELPAFQADKDENSEIEALYFVYKTAARFYYDQLQSSAGQAARDYLRKRGFDEKTLKSFGVGYAPDEWDALARWTQSQRIDLKILEKGGLITAKSGGYYDRFRHRLIFPIFNISGRVIAFGGRLLREEPNSPKYLNSPEHPIYHKGKTLYGLSHAKDAVRRQDNMIIVEGYADCLSLHQFGVTNVTASSGTAFTMDQANLIRRFTQNVTLIYDGDDAGIRAAERGGALMLEAGLNVHIVVLPDKHDPDSYIRKEGVTAFESLIQKGLGYIDFRIAMWNHQNKLDSVNARTNAIRELLNIVARINDAIKRDLFVKEIASKMGVDAALVQKELRSVTRHATPGDERPKITVTPVAVVKPPISERITKAERNILRTLLAGQRRDADHVFSYIRADEFQNDAIRKVVEWVFNRFMLNEPFSSDHISGHFDETIERAISKLLIEDTGQYEIDELLAVIQSRQLESKMETLRNTILNMELEKEDTTELTAMYNFLNRQLLSLRNKKQLIKLDEKPLQERIDF